MTINPIIQSKLEEFAENCYIAENKDRAFERYVNYNILKKLYPECASDMDLFDRVCIGGGEDLGIDGIIIAINDQPVSELQEVKDILQSRTKITIDIVLIQSKNTDSFKQEGVLKFSQGIELFLKSDKTIRGNDDVENWREILDEISKVENLRKWKRLPSVKGYYVTLGKWDNQKYVISAIKSLKDSIKNHNTYNLLDINCVDAEGLLRIIDENEDDYVATIKVEQRMGLPKAENVESSSIYLCKAENLLHLLVSDEGNLRRELFEDNVRDYQGDTDINISIRKTIKDKPDQFLLLNNGVTIVCKKMNDPNMELTMYAPQIVNGCQTCSVIYECHQDQIDITGVYVVLKVVASLNEDIVNSVVKGTNRQNIVYEEAFETTRDFHKRLEEFFLAKNKDNEYPVFYERRQKQFLFNPSVKIHQIINFRILIQSYVAIFMNSPHDAIHHESVLLKKYKVRIFQETDSFYPYYVSALLFKMLNNTYRQKRDRNKPFIMQVAFIMKELLMKEEKKPKFFNGKAIEQYCESLLGKIINPSVYSSYEKKARERFEEISKKWVEEKGENYKYGRRDSEEFTQFMIRCLETEKSERQYIGKISSICRDRYGRIYGYINNGTEKLFFHACNKGNSDIDNTYLNLPVSYELGNSKKGKETPINIRKI